MEAVKRIALVAHGDTGRQLFEAIPEFLPTRHAVGFLTGIHVSGPGAWVPFFAYSSVA